MKKKSHKCDKGWYSGDCCCNCQNQSPVMKQPGNKPPFKGPVSDRLGWVCTVAIDIDGKTSPCYFTDREHGYCELHSPISKTKNPECIKSDRN